MSHPAPIVQNDPGACHRRPGRVAWVFIGSLAVAIFAHLCPGQEGPPPTRPESQLAGEVDVARLIDLVAARSGATIDYEPETVKGRIVLRAGSPLSDEELWGLLGNSLASRGQAIIRRPGRGNYSVVKLADAAGSAALTRVGGDPAGPLPSYRTVLVTVAHRPPKELAEALTKLSSKPGGAVSDLGDGLLLLSDLSPRLDQMLGVLALLDTPAAPTAVREVEARHLTPVQLATLVAQVSLKRESVSGERIRGDVLPSGSGRSVLVVAPESRLEYWMGLVAELDRREEVQVRTYTPAHFAVADVARVIERSAKDSDDRWKLVVDELTGTLLLTARPAQHATVEDLLARMAAMPSGARRPVRTFVIKNRPVRELKDVLDRLLQAGAVDAGATPDDGAHPPAAPEAAVVTPLPPPPAEPGATPGAAAAPPFGVPTAGLPKGGRGQPPTPAAGPTRSPAEPPLTLTVDEGTNTLIAVGEPRLLAQIEALLKTLDVRQPQVMLEVLMVTLTEGQTLDLGVELEQLQVSGSVRIRLASLFGLSGRAGGGPGGGLDPGDPAGFTGVVLSPGDFSMVIRALQTISHGRSLSMPKLLVGNNQQASLDSVLLQPFASVNAANTVATTSYGGSQDAGTVITIKPQIAEGDHLLLDYSVSLSSFVGAASAATLPPPKQQNKVQSAATIPDGYTVVVGGIELENDSRSVSQVPLLGRIPVIGEVFKSRSNSGNRSRFYVFIRANILRHRGFEDLKYLSDRDVARAGVDDGWPVVEPRVIK